MPALLWKNGISSITNMKVSHKVGMMLTVVIPTLTDEGKEFFDHALPEVNQQNNMHHCFQMLLSYWMWLKKMCIGKKVARL